ncbi:MAG: SAM-dependent methyltransferase, partial [Planctomycetaceae bacterium]
MSAADELRTRIRARGPISFAEFMEVALYGPDGFYADPPVGVGGHFVTSPHVHPIFAELLASAIASSWSEMGEAGKPRVIEVGAGDGTLAAQLAPHVGAYVAVERSAAGRQALAERGIEAVEDLADLSDGGTAVIVANELLDNLPFDRVRAHADGLR